MDANLVTTAGEGVSKALNVRNLVYVAVILAVVIVMMKFFTKNEIVDNNGNVTGTLRSKLAFNKDRD